MAGVVPADHATGFIFDILRPTPFETSSTPILKTYQYHTSQSQIFSKIFEKILKEQLSPFLDKTLSIFIAAYRIAYNTQHVLIKLLEEWKSKLDNNFIVGSILMDLSKAFDCIPHDLIIAKLHAYGFDENALVLVYSYLEKWKQSVRINNVYSSFQEIVSGVPQGSVLGPILFNFYINNLFSFIKQATMYNYADDNTLAFFSKSLPGLVNVLENEADSALSWLKQNEMIANPNKFHALFVKKRPDKYLWRKS